MAVLTGRVEYVEGSESLSLPNEADACRIKVRLDSDGDTPTSQLPWAFPLNSKVFQSIPKAGEGVFVFLANDGRTDSQRFYQGPIISQPQYQEFCDYGEVGRGPAMSLLTSSAKPLTEAPLTAISRKKELTHGSFPDVQDIALIGRGQEDVILKYRTNKQSKESEIDLRAGIRLQPTDSTIKYMKGNIVFNSVDPAYIQIKHSTTGLAGLKSGKGDNDPNKYENRSERNAKGVVNVVADKINLISHGDNNAFGRTIADKDDLIKNGELDDIMSMLHRAVYGDELIIILKKIVNVLASHTHPYNMLPPTIGGTELNDLIGYPFENIISPHVRIS